MLRNKTYLSLCVGALLFPQVLFAANTEPEAPPPVVAPAPKSGFSGSYLSSQFARMSGDMDSAISYLQTIHRKDPDNIDVASQLMGLMLLKGQVDGAVKIASSIAKNKGNEPIASLILSLQAIKEKDMQKAARILDDSFQDDSGQLWLPLISAWLDVENRKLTRPLMMEELSADVGRAAPIVQYHLALINAKAGFIQAAADNFRQAIEEPENPPARVMQMLLQFYEKNKTETLKPIVDAYRAANPDGPMAADDVKIHTVQDGIAEVLLTMGTIMLSADAVQDATLYLQLALYLKPDMTVAMLSLAEAYSDLKQYGVANEIFAKIPASSKFYNTAKLHVAMNLGRMGKSNEAVAALDALIKQSPNHVDAYIAKGDLLRTNDKMPEAIAAYNVAISTLTEAKPQHWLLFFARGTCYERQGNWPAAEKDLRRALELKPGQADTLNYLGYSMLTRGENIAEARDMIEKAVRQRPNDPQIIDSMGWALYLLGEYEKAVEYLEKAVELLPADAIVNDHLGDVYWRLLRKTEARFQWERALSFSPDATLEDAINKKLKDGLPPVMASSPAAQKTAQTPTNVVAAD